MKEKQTAPKGMHDVKIREKKHPKTEPGAVNHVPPVPQKETES